MQLAENNGNLFISEQLAFEMQTSEVSAKPYFVLRLSSRHLRHPRHSSIDFFPLKVITPTIFGASDFTLVSLLLILEPLTASTLQDSLRTKFSIFVFC